MKTSIRKILILSFLCLPLSHLCSQVLSKKELIKAIHTADISYYYDEDYEKAASLYESLLKLYPDNSNLSAKLGICYLSIDGRKTDALKLLIKASSNVVYNDNEYLEYGEKAPLDTYLYLAIAYHKNDSLQKAVSLFYDAKRRLGGTEIFREEFIDNQIRDCRYAMEMKKKPLTIISDLFAPWLNEYPGACNPVLSRNDSVFVFTVKNNGKTKILCSYKSGTWRRPVDITRQLGGYNRFYSNSITGDGRLLIIYMDDGGDGNLYYSQRKDTTWSKIKSVGKKINTIYWESHGFITPDGKTMYFASNRPKGKGNLDIWISEKAVDGTWEHPENCGDVINTPYNENTPFFDPATESLFFSSMGQPSMGGYDVLKSSYNNGGWTNPIGMPYAFNNTLENIFFIVNNNASGFITSLYNDKTKSRNIYSIVAKDPTDKITLAGGSVILLDGMDPNPEKAQVKLINIKSPKLFQTIPLTDSGSFKFEIKPGDYQLLVIHAGYKTDTINLSLPLYFSGNCIAVIVSLVPEKVFTGDFLSVTNILFEFDSYELSEQGKFNLEILKSKLIEYPDLRIDVTGYSDAVGSTEYNILLSDKRAQAVIDYFSSKGISPTRISKKALGESDFVEKNTNSDGSDNPEGRKYNRRAVIEVVNPQTGIIINQDTYTPEHLRQPYSMKYNIILIKAREILPPDYFNNLLLDKTLFVNPVKKDSVFWYVLGIFYNKPEALDYLTLAKEKGFEDASIMNQYELNNELVSTDTPGSGSKQLITQKVFTIQLLSTRQPVNISQFFKELMGVNEIQGNDGLYKYTVGEYLSMPEAEAALLPLQEAGYKGASVIEVNTVIFK